MIFSHFNASASETLMSQAPKQLSPEIITSPPISSAISRAFLFIPFGTCRRTLAISLIRIDPFKRLLPDSLLEDAEIICQLQILHELPYERYRREDGEYQNDRQYPL